jgi:hypothetical protein
MFFFSENGVARSRKRTTKEEEGRSKGGPVKKGEEVERVELWGQAHEGKALFCSYSLSGRLGECHHDVRFPRQTSAKLVLATTTRDMNRSTFGDDDWRWEGHRGEILTIAKGWSRMRAMTGHRRRSRSRA